MFNTSEAGFLKFYDGAQKQGLLSSLAFPNLRANKADICVTTNSSSGPSTVPAYCSPGNNTGTTVFPENFVGLGFL